MAGPMVAGVEEEVLRAYEFDGCQRYDGALQIHAILLRVIVPRTADRIKGLAELHHPVLRPRLAVAARHSLNAKPEARMVQQVAVPDDEARVLNMIHSGGKRHCAGVRWYVECQ